MTDLSAFAGVYADLRQVKSRGVWQLVLDIPAEKVEGMVKLFGMPRQDEPTWLAVARLTVPPGANGTAVRSSAEAGTPTPLKPAAPQAGAKREKTLPEKVGMRCNDERFQKWLLGEEFFYNGEDTADVVRRVCGVESRKEILPGTEAAKKWRDMETRYLADTGQMAERR